MSDQILYSAPQAARMLGLSLSSFKRHAQPYLAVALIGDRPLRRYSRGAHASPPAGCGGRSGPC